MVRNITAATGSRDEEYEQFKQYEQTVKTVIPVVFGVITILGLCGNSLVIYIVAFNKKLRTATYMLILNLAIADLLFIVVCVPFTATVYVLPRWIFGRVWCKIYQYFSYVCACVSVYSLVFMSLARCIAVVRPMSTKALVTKRNTCIAIVILWVIILIGYTPLLVQFDVYRYEYLGDERVACMNVKALYDRDVEKVFFANFFVFGYILPLYFMIILYSILLTALKCGKKNIETLSKERTRANRRATRMVIAVVLAFMLLWLPIQVIFMIQSFGHYTTSLVGVAFQMTANCLAYFSSCVNPILYTFLSTRFRNSFTKALCCGRTTNSENSRSTLPP